MRQRLVRLYFILVRVWLRGDTEETRGVNLPVRHASGSHVLTLVIFQTLHVNRIYILSGFFHVYFIFFYNNKCDKSQDSLEWCFPKKIYTEHSNSRKIRLWTVIHCMWKTHKHCTYERRQGVDSTPVKSWQALSARDPVSSVKKIFLQVGSN